MSWSKLGAFDVENPYLLIAVPWFRRESYEQIRKLPGCDFYGEFDDWEIRAQRLFEVMRRTSNVLIRVFLEAQELSEFAKKIGATAITASVRTSFANAKLTLGEEMPVPDVPINCYNCRRTYAVPGGVLTMGVLVEIGCACGGILRHRAQSDLRRGWRSAVGARIPVAMPAGYEKPTKGRADTAHSKGAKDGP